ncbi:MAG: hypothetical protein LBB23_04965 [Rickettsiales bacterium]|nr:hypothetical protein [Rickettsiales bacterium]
MFSRFSLAVAVAALPLAANAVSNMTVPAAAGSNAPGATSAANAMTRGNAGKGQEIRQQYMQNYYMNNVPDVDTACRQKIYNCLSQYCGDMTTIPGVMPGRCQYASEGELYNWAVLCIQKDYEDLMPQYNFKNMRTNLPTNTAARLCPSYIQQELMTYLSMANMADSLALQRSSGCVNARAELAAALSCHETTMVYAYESSSMLQSMLTDSCGSGVAGGSTTMVRNFLQAGNVGANVWGWMEKLVNLDASEKARGFEVKVDAIAAGYVNKMNAACGENMQFQAVKRPVDNSPTTLQNLANLALGMSPLGKQAAAAGKSSGGASFPGTGGASGSGGNLTMTINSNYAIYDYATAAQVVQAGLTNPITVQNPFLTSKQMNDMQNAQKSGTKVFMIKDQSRCFIVAMDALTQAENNLLAPHLATCAYN